MPSRTIITTIIITERFLSDSRPESDENQ